LLQTAPTERALLGGTLSVESEKPVKDLPIEALADGIVSRRLKWRDRYVDPAVGSEHLSIHLDVKVAKVADDILLPARVF